MKKIFILLFFSSFQLTYAAKLIPHVLVHGLVLEENTLDPLELATVQLWQLDSLWFEFESNSDGEFQINISYPDTFDLKVISGGYHSQTHPGMIIESTKIHGRLDIFLIPNDTDTVDIHCHERCWCIYHEEFDRLNDTLVEFKGLILDYKTKNPIPFAWVNIFDTNGTMVGRGMSDWDGYYQIDSIVSDSLIITVSEWYHEYYDSPRIWVGNGTVQWNDILLKKDRYYPSYEDWTPPPVDLFAEEQRINDSLALVMPSSEYEDAEVELSLIGYPNPFMSTIQIDRLPENENIKIVDIMGIVRQTIPVQNQTSVMLDLPELQKGLYFIHYEENGQKKNYAIVKK